jgi:hypothetical protein
MAHQVASDSRLAYLAYQLGRFAVLVGDGVQADPHVLAESVDGVEQLAVLLKKGKEQKQQALNTINEWATQGGLCPDSEEVSRSASKSNPEQTVLAFCSALPHKYSAYAQLGHVIYVIRRRDMHALTGSTTPLVRLQQLLDEIRQIDTHLIGVGVNLSESAHTRMGHTYSNYGELVWEKDLDVWRRLNVEVLEAEIIDRLLVPTPRFPSFWITGKQAAAIGTELGYKIKQDTLSKALDEVPTPFLYRKPHKQRLEIELVSFLAYLQGLGRGDKEPTTDAEIKCIEARKAEEQAKKARERPADSR